MTEKKNILKPERKREEKRKRERKENLSSLCD